MWRARRNPQQHHLPCRWCNTTPPRGTNSPAAGTVRRHFQHRAAQLHVVGDRCTFLKLHRTELRGPGMTATVAAAATAGAAAPLTWHLTPSPPMQWLVPRLALPHTCSGLHHTAPHKSQPLRRQPSDGPPFSVCHPKPQTCGAAAARPPTTTSPTTGQTRRPGALHGPHVTPH